MINDNYVNNKPIIQVDNLFFAYKKDKWILKNVSFNIKKTEIVALTGKSGTGKTTLGFILKGLIPHSIRGYLKGNIQADGMDIKKTPIYKIAKSIGMVFQDLNSQLFSNSVKDEIEFGLKNLRLNLEWANEAMNFLGISELSNEFPINLSAGQKQRVILASIIATHPKILILDEPSAHLDNISKNGLKKWLKILNEQFGITIIIIEQDPWILGEICDKFLYVQNNNINQVNKEDILEKKAQWCWKN